MVRIFLLSAALLLGWASNATANWPQRLEQQRDAFREAWPKALGGDAAAVRDNATLLSDYPLYPDLRGAWLRSQVGKVADKDVRDFLEQHGDIYATRDLRRRWAGSLAARGHWSDFLQVYREHYADANDERFTCLALTARLRAGNLDGLDTEAHKFWMHGHSRPDECDPVFDWLEKNKLISDEDRRQRIALALEQRQFALAAWLARSLSDKDQQQVQRWRQMRQRSAGMLAKPSLFSDSETDRELVLYGVRRVARKDVAAATTQWQNYAQRLSFDEATRNRIERDLAYYAARDYEPGAVSRVLSLPPRAVDDRLLEAGVRAALRDQDWRSVLSILDAMSDTNKRKSEWRYWRARALEGTGATAAAASIYDDLAGQRGFYSFLSADRLDQPYAYNHVPAVADDNLMVRLNSTQSLVRAREMFFVDLHGRGRSEWERYIADLPRDEQLQSALLANRWGWHSVAISTAFRAGARDDLELRYPIAFREAFETHTNQLDLSATWAYGIARSESLFMPDVTSSAGALGVMQLMPETGRLTARQARIRYRGRHTLLDPQQNIALGTFYLDKMYSRFGDHQVLATAAYNAGPHRVARWLPEDEAIASDIWVETVPYKETRGYLRRVLSADVIFHWRLTGNTRRLAAIMPPVEPAAR